MSNIKISIALITYNQEYEIIKALNSLIIQKEYIYEIIVSDDCSTDNTWNNINELRKEFPELIKPHRNNTNLGIFENWENTLKKVTGNIIYLMAGDDTVEPELFRKTHEIIISNKLNCDYEKFSIYFDFTLKYNDNRTKLFSNKLLLKKYLNPVSLKLRGLILNRTILYSKCVKDLIKPVNKEIGIYADELLDIQIPINSDKFFYSTYIGSSYYYGIGIASKTKLTDHWKSLILSLDKISELYNFSKYDQAWIKFKQNYFIFLLNHTFRNYIKMWLYFIKSINLKLGISIIEILRLLYTFRYYFKRK